MVTINLRDFYPWVTGDELVTVSDEVAAVMLEDRRLERNYARRVFYNKAHYSLDAGDGIENDALYMAVSPHEVYEQRLIRCRLCRALNSLPETQGRRIEVHYIHGISKAEIARAEGISEKNVRQSIERGLQNMRRYMKKDC